MPDKLIFLIRTLQQSGPVMFLDSQSRDHPSSQKSYLAGEPDAMIEAYGSRIIIYHPNGYAEEREGNPWEVFREFRKLYPGWHFGWFGYDLKNHTEKLKSENLDPVGLPDLFFFRPGKLFGIDPVSNHINIMLNNGVETMYEAIAEQEPPAVSNLRSDLQEAGYLAMVREAQHLIREGEFYEINLSHQLSADFTGDALGLYESMKQNGPVPFGAYACKDDITVCCESPERFLKKEGSRLTSEPIKGTIRRGINDHEDELLKEEIQNSGKNKAENLMIVDLVRNDLGRIAKKGSVRVEKFYELQTFSTLHQMVSTITAELDADTDAVDAVKACFPMGSMTGAPKIRSMEMIEKLESCKRGIYSGAMGYFTPHDNFDFNVVIRTAVVKGSKLYYSTGGAITTDSVPFEEWDETWVKARALTNLKFPRTTKPKADEYS